MGQLSGAGKESVTLLPGLPPCSPLRLYFVQSPLGSGFCPAESSHLFMAACWHEPEKVPCSSEVVFGCTPVPFQSREYHRQPRRAHTSPGLPSRLVGLKAAVSRFAHHCWCMSSCSICAQLPCIVEMKRWAVRVWVTAVPGMPPCLHPSAAASSTRPLSLW